MAKKRAEIIVASVGEQLGKAKEIHPSCSLDSARVFPRAYSSFAMNKVDSDGAVEQSSAVDVIEAGTINVRASVNMIYYLK